MIKEYFGFGLLGLLVYGLLVVLIIDFFVFVAWVLSGQVAPDKYHAGIISESIINVIK
jgi:hypothetical protein